MNHSELRGDIKSATCACCGRAFVVMDPETWTYKGRYHKCQKYFCSYGCRQKYEREFESALPKRTRRSRTRRQMMSF